MLPRLIRRVWFGYCAALIGIAAGTSVLKLLGEQINPTTVALAFLLLILFVATAWGSVNVIEGDEIVVTGLEHHANFVPWQQLALHKRAELRICRLTPDGQIDVDALSLLLSRRTKVLAFPHVSKIGRAHV